MDEINDNEEPVSFDDELFEIKTAINEIMDLTEKQFETQGNEIEFVKNTLYDVIGKTDKMKTELNALLDTVVVLSEDKSIIGKIKRWFKKEG